jgi:Uma2 family endonuclease
LNAEDDLMAATTTRTGTDWLADALLDLAPGQRVYATGIPWAVYTRLANLRDERRPGVKITFDGGRIELMSPKFRHEQPSRLLSLVITVLAEEMGMQLVGTQSTTFRQEQTEHGLEPDQCFYIAHARDLIGVDDIDLSIHPPPDLAVEVDLSHSTVSKEAIYAPMGVPELWRHDDDEVTIRHLRADGTYQTVGRSLAFPPVTAADLTKLLGDGRTEDEIAFVRRCRAWAKTLVPPTANP